jgi:hypothetical protein
VEERNVKEKEREREREREREKREAKERRAKERKEGKWKRGGNLNHPGRQSIVHSTIQSSLAVSSGEFSSSQLHSLFTLFSFCFWSKFCFRHPVLLLCVEVLKIVDLRFLCTTIESKANK